jgi:hypothetical protein
MRRREHKLFKHYPLSGKTPSSMGDLPTPYHIYDGYGAFIGGFAKLDAIRDLLRNDHVFPIESEDGDALMGVWICNFEDGSLDPHHELQFSIFVSRKKIDNVPTHPLGLLRELASRPDIEMMCHGLWNNTRRVVTYNREVLSLPARLSSSSISLESRSLKFQVTDELSSRIVCTGELSSPRQASMLANLSLLKQLGLRKSWQLSQESWLGLRIVNPIRDGIGHNLSAQSFTKNDADRLRYFDPKMDRLTLGEYEHVQFEPQFIQHMQGIKFVYLRPERVA